MKARASLWLSLAAKRDLRRRAAAHGMSMSAYAEAVLMGHRPGGAPGQEAAAADDWWDSLPPARRAGIHGWVGNDRNPSPDPGPDQLTIFEGSGAP